MTDRTIRDVKKYRLLVNMPWLKKGMIIIWSDGGVNKESGTLANDISRYLSRLYRQDQDEWKLYFEELKQPEKQCTGCSPELAGNNGGSPGHTCEQSPGTFHEPEKKGGSGATRDQIIKAETNYITGGKQEIDVSHEITADMADFNDVVYNRDCIIELQKVVNKLLEK